MAFHPLETGSLYLRAESINDLCACHAVRPQGRNEWRFGSLGSREATVSHVLAGEASDAQRAAFDRERGQWLDRARKLGEAMPSRRRRRRLRAVGDVVEVGRYLDDRPDCWERLERGRSLPSVTIGFNIAFSCGNTEADFARTVGQAAACCWALCEAGFPVRIIGCAIGPIIGGANAGAWGGPFWFAKDYPEPLDVERLLSYGHPGLLRDCCFGVFEGMLDATAGGGVYWAREASRPQAEALGVDLFLGRSWIAGTDGGALILQRTQMQGFERSDRA